MSAASYSRSNHLSLLHRGAEFFPALIHAIDAAHDQNYLETYIFALDDTANQVRDALIRAASRGVMVHVLVDWLGTGKSTVTLLQAAFEPSGVHFVAFNPWFQRGVARAHRKIVVIDQRLAFLGGLNINDDLISDDDSGKHLPAPRWDFAVSIIGPLVDDVHAEVAAQWKRQSSQTLRRRLGRVRQWYASRVSLQWQVAEAALVVRDNLRNRAAIERQLLQALGRAHHSAVLVTPYFAPGRKLRRAMLHAAARGVDITLLIGVGQFVMQDAVAQSFYPRFIRAGIHILSNILRLSCTAKRLWSMTHGRHWARAILMACHCSLIMKPTSLFEMPVFRWRCGTSLRVVWPRARSLLLKMSRSCRGCDESQIVWLTCFIAQY